MAVKPTTFVLIGAGGAAFLAADALPLSPPQRAAVKFGGLALGVLGVFRLLDELKASGGLLGATLGAVVPIGPAEERVTSEKTIPELPAAPGLDPSRAAEEAALARAARDENVQGVALGGLSIAVPGSIVRPAESSTVSRSLFGSSIEVEIALENVTSSPVQVLVELAGFFERLFGDERRRSTVGLIALAPHERKRVVFEWDTGDRHTGIFETGAANVAAELLVDGRTVASSLFKVN